jgi:hypothetical protein
MPIIPVIGVRISWLIIARKSDLAMGRGLGGFGAELDLAAQRVSLRFRGARGLGGVGFLRRVQEQPHEIVGDKDQHAGFQSEDAGMKPDPAQIRAARKNRRRNHEIQYQMMQDDGDGAGQDRPVVAIEREARQRREEVHMNVDLPGLSGQLVGKHAHAAHQRDGNQQSRRQVGSRRAPGQRRHRRECKHEQAGNNNIAAQPQADRQRDRNVQPEHRDQGLAGGAAHRVQILVVSSHFEIPDSPAKQPAMATGLMTSQAPARRNRAMPPSSPARTTTTAGTPVSRTMATQPRPNFAARSTTMESSPPRPRCPAQPAATVMRARRSSPSAKLRHWPRPAIAVMSWWSAPCVSGTSPDKA